MSFTMTVQVNMQRLELKRSGSFYLNDFASNVLLFPRYPSTLNCPAVLFSV